MRDAWRPFSSVIKLLLVLDDVSDIDLLLAILSFLTARSFGPTMEISQVLALLLL